MHAGKSTKPLRFDGGYHTHLTEGPLSVFISKKYSKLDFLWADYFDDKSHGVYYLLSPRFGKLLEEIQATGFFLRQMHAKLGFEHAAWERDYRQLVITGWGGIAKGMHRVESHRGSHCYSLPDTKDFFDIQPLKSGMA